MNYAEKSLQLHQKWNGKFEVSVKVPLTSQEDLALAYTPGVASSCLEIQKDPAQSYALTARNNLCAVITDGSAVLGLGDIGPEAGMPVMEGKCVLFKEFGGVNAIPLCVNTKDVDEFVQTVYHISGSFGGINLEDIAAPRCFEIEKRLQELCDIPVFHDDQHGTAVVVLSGLINALKVVNKKKEEVKVVISGAGSAAIAISRLLLRAGFQNLVLSDKFGAVYRGCVHLNPAQKEIAEITNPANQTGNLAELLKGADILIGVSAPNLVTGEMIQSMNRDPVVFACANPVPEIMPEAALAAGAKIVATGRSDYPNKINNVLAFPGIFRGALDVRAREINEEMKMAASYAIADLISDDERRPEYIIPAALDQRVHSAVAQAVRNAAIQSGVSRI